MRLALGVARVTSQMRKDLSIVRGVINKEKDVVLRDETAKRLGITDKNDMAELHQAKERLEQEIREYESPTISGERREKALAAGREAIKREEAHGVQGTLDFSGGQSKPAPRPEPKPEKKPESPKPTPQAKPTETDANGFTRWKGFWVKPGTWKGEEGVLLYDKPDGSPTAFINKKPYKTKRGIQRPGFVTTLKDDRDSAKRVRALYDWLERDNPNAGKSKVERAAEITASWKRYMANEDVSMFVRQAEAAGVSASLLADVPVDQRVDEHDSTRGNDRFDDSQLQGFRTAIYDTKVNDEFPHSATFETRYAQTGPDSWRRIRRTVSRQVQTKKNADGTYDYEEVTTDVLYHEDGRTVASVSSKMGDKPYDVEAMFDRSGKVLSRTVHPTEKTAPAPGPKPQPPEAQEAKPATPAKPKVEKTKAEQESKPRPFEDAGIINQDALKDPATLNTVENIFANADKRREEEKPKPQPPEAQEAKPAAPATTPAQGSTALAKPKKELKGGDKVDDFLKYVGLTREPPEQNNRPEEAARLRKTLHEAASRQPSAGTTPGLLRGDDEPIVAKRLDDVPGKIAFVERARQSLLVPGMTHPRVRLNGANFIGAMAHNLELEQRSPTSFYGRFNPTQAPERELTLRLSDHSINPKNAEAAGNTDTVSLAVFRTYASKKDLASSSVPIREFRYTRENLTDDTMRRILGDLSALFRTGDYPNKSGGDPFPKQIGTLREGTASDNDRRDKIMFGLPKLLDALLGANEDMRTFADFSERLFGLLDSRGNRQAWEVLKPYLQGAWLTVGNLRSDLNLDEPSRAEARAIFDEVERGNAETAEPEAQQTAQSGTPVTTIMQGRIQAMIGEPSYSLRLAKSVARWADKHLPETGATVWEALGALPTDDRFPCPEALMFLRDWLVTNPLRVFQMTGPGLADEMVAVATAAKILENQPRPCRLMEAIQAWGHGWRG